jgi:hypothetical protein
MWREIHGDADTCTIFKTLPLWYAHYDNTPSFDDWNSVSKFGGWVWPTLKQFKGDSVICGTRMDVSYY